MSCSSLAERVLSLLEAKIDHSCPKPHISNKIYVDIPVTTLFWVVPMLIIDIVLVEEEDGAISFSSHDKNLVFEYDETDYEEVVSQLAILIGQEFAIYL